MRIFKMVPFVGILLLLAITGSNARIHASLTYKQSFDRSDLVVIATPTEKTADTKETAYVLNVFRQDENGKQAQLESVGVETPFRVSVVLKGDAVLKQFVLHHYRLVNPGMALKNGPMLVSFGAPPDTTILHSYLLFLVREPDGRYAPTGGQTDPAYYAIHELPFERQ